ncbi:MAG: type I-F CRISPR-associated protein Csy2 [Methylococcales bacterium]|nr:type I-F CRISPR-associated protein Csy2 [Methylococcales bacterium]
MNQYILINRIKVQNANAIAGFTWGFPAITHFLGFTHNLSRKLANTDDFNDIYLSGCAVIAHEHHVHTYSNYGEYEFTQSRNPAYQHGEESKNKVNTPPVIEEGKMNMTVSLLIEYKGHIGGNSSEDFNMWLKKSCFLQRLAGGTILDIHSIDILDDKALRIIKGKLIPGFILRDSSSYLEEHYQALSKDNENVELLDVWLDFIALKQKARPTSDLISKHFKKLNKSNPTENQYSHLIKTWQEHLETPYQVGITPTELSDYFNQLENNKTNAALLTQWQNYCSPDEKTNADWEYIEKPKNGYLVPIMVGYKAISDEYEKCEVENIRAKETDDDVTKVTFVESVHSIGKWQSVHRLKDIEEISNCIWHYHYEKNWYLCKQGAYIQQPQDNNTYSY